MGEVNEIQLISGCGCTLAQIFEGNTGHIYMSIKSKLLESHTYLTDNYHQPSTKNMSELQTFSVGLDLAT